jgi:hypothetical protein
MKALAGAMIVSVVVVMPAMAQRVTVPAAPTRPPPVLMTPDQLWPAYPDPFLLAPELYPLLPYVLAPQVDLPPEPVVPRGRPGGGLGVTITGGSPPPVITTPTPSAPPAATNPAPAPAVTNPPSANTTNGSIPYTGPQLPIQ